MLETVDEFIDDLLVKTRVCATTLPKINPRLFLEDEDRLEPRVSALGEELEALDEDSDNASHNDDDEARSNSLNGDGHDARNGNGHSISENGDSDG